MKTRLATNTLKLTMLYTDAIRTTGSLGWSTWLLWNLGLTRDTLADMYDRYLILVTAGRAYPRGLIHSYGSLLANDIIVISIPYSQFEEQLGVSLMYRRP